MDRNRSKYDTKVDNFRKLTVLFEVTHLKIRKKAYIQKSVVHIGPIILLILSRYRLTTTTDTALEDITHTQACRSCSMSVHPSS